jgi:hypothetical protein
LLIYIKGIVNIYKSISLFILYEKREN